MPIKIEGKTVRARDGRELVLPPLDVRTMRRFTREGKLAQVVSIASGGILPTDDQWGAIVDLLHAGLLCNYPDLTADEVEGMVDFSNLESWLDALFFASGFRKVPPGEGSSPSTGTT